MAINTASKLSVGLILAVVAMIFLPATNALDISMSGNAGSSSQHVSSAIDEQFLSTMALSSEGLSNTVSGSGDFSDVHAITNKHDRAAEVGVSIVGSDKYAYTYSIDANDRESQAREYLDVDDAEYIHAYAKAHISDSHYSIAGRVKGDHTTYSGIEIVDGSLHGYSNQALAGA